MIRREMPCARLHTPGIFFQRHVASLQSRIFSIMTLCNVATAVFPEILAGKSSGLPFLQKFWLYRHSDCLFYRNSGFANLAPACIFFPEAFRIIAKRFSGNFI